MFSFFKRKKTSQQRASGDVQQGSLQKTFPHFWIVATLIMAVFFIGLILSETGVLWAGKWVGGIDGRGGESQNGEVQKTGQASDQNGSKQAVKPPLFTLPITVVYKIDDPNATKVQELLDVLGDPGKGLVSTTLVANRIDFASKEGEKIVKESGSKYLPIFFFDKTLEQHPQFEALQSFLEKKADRYYFHAYPIQHLQTPSIKDGHSERFNPALGMVQTGGADTPVAILEYGSFSCIHCQEMEEVLTRILKEYPAKVSLVYKHFDRGGYDSVLAQGTECANEQNKFWALHDYLFKDQQKVGESINKILNGAADKNVAVDKTLTIDIAARTYLQEIAGSLGLNAAALRKCLDSEKYKKLVEDQTKEADDYGVNGTPAFFINGKFHDGAFAYEDFKVFVEEAIMLK